MPLMDREYHVVYMPLNKDGNGPASPDEAIYDTWEVWDSVNNTLVICMSEAHAEEIVWALNSVPLYNGNVQEFDT